MATKEEDLFPPIPYKPVKHDWNGYLIEENEGVYPRTYRVTRPGDEVIEYSAERYGLALKLAHADYHQVGKLAQKQQFIDQLDQVITLTNQVLDEHTPTNANQED